MLGFLHSLSWKSNAKFCSSTSQLGQINTLTPQVLHAGLTVAEHFRDAEGQDVLLFIDNIFRFTQVELTAIGHMLHIRQSTCFA